MKTIGDFHEIVGKLMECADFFQEHGDPNEVLIARIVEQMYNDHLELAKGQGLKDTDPYLTSLKYIKEWLDGNKVEL